MLYKFILSFLFLNVSLYAGTIIIAVATNVTFPTQELKKEFKKLNPNTKIRVTFGSSGKLTSQIINGAPFELFMSANMDYPNYLYDYGIAITKPIIYVQGALVYFSVNKMDFSKGINLLSKKEISKIAVANPITAPYGKAAFEAMKNAGVLKAIMKKFLYAKSISGTVSNTLNIADIGIISKSALYVPKMKKYKEHINWVDIDPRLYTPINQGIVILKAGKNSDEVKAFYEFILSNKAKEIFKNFGYFIPYNRYL